MTKASTNDGTDSALGFSFQGFYALLVLLDAADDDQISVETADDVVADGTNPRLIQLKHSIGNPSALNEKNDGLWKTINIWLNNNDSKWNYLFVTCAKIEGGCALNDISNTKTSSPAKAIALLEAEANRVIAAVDASEKVAGNPPYQDRIKGCRAFMALTGGQRLAFVSRITILGGTATILNIEAEVGRCLTTYPKVIRSQLAVRLCEWWDYRIARSLCGRASREVTKNELLDKIQAIARSLDEDSLPDDFSTLSPPTLEGELGSMMERQILLVEGGASRLQRAAQAGWRARNQRNRWLRERVGLSDVLDQFDKKLIEHWKDRHGPLTDDCATQPPEQKTRDGRLLLDWSHLKAHLEVPPPRPRWEPAFLVQGTYQQLADQLIVGWHPEYESILKDAQSSPSDSEPPNANNDPAKK